MLLLRSRHLHRMPHFSLVDRVGHGGLLGKAAHRAGSGQPVVALPHPVPPPTQHKSQGDRCRHAAPAPPLVALLVPGGRFSRSPHKRRRNRRTEQIGMQLPQCRALGPPCSQRGQRSRIAGNARLKPGRSFGRQTAVCQRVHFILCNRLGVWRFKVFHGGFPAHLRRLSAGMALRALPDSPAAAAGSAPSISSRSRVRARDRRDMTVPTGTPNTLAACS